MIQGDIQMEEIQMEETKEFEMVFLAHEIMDGAMMQYWIELYDKEKGRKMRQQKD